MWGRRALTGLALLACTERIGWAPSSCSLGSRSPALLATSALSLQELCPTAIHLLGIGKHHLVMEGWHGNPEFTVLSRPPGDGVEIIRMVPMGPP